MNHLDPDELRRPAYLRKKAIVRQSRQKLILTALDRKQAGLGVHSHKALAPMKSYKSVKEKSSASALQKTIIKKSTATSFPYRQEQIASASGPFQQTEQKQTNQYRAKTSFLNRLLPVQTDEVENEQRYETPTGFVKIIPIGHITAYFEKIQVAVMKLEKPLRLGDIIQITAEDLLFQQPVDSMQINRKSIKIAKKGSEIGLKVSHQPKLNGAVYKVLV